MISESVYHMDRGHGALVTNRQVVIEGRRYELAHVRDAFVKNRHVSGETRVEFHSRVTSAITLLIAILLKGFFWDSNLGQTLFGLDMCLFTASLLTLVVFAATARPRYVVMLSKLSGSREELFSCSDRRYACDLAQAVHDAANDYQSGRAANSRGASRR